MFTGTLGRIYSPAENRSSRSGTALTGSGTAANLALSAGIDGLAGVTSAIVVSRAAALAAIGRLFRVPAAAQDARDGETDQGSPRTECSSRPCRDAVPCSRDHSMRDGATMRAGRIWLVGAVVALGALAGCAGSQPETSETSEKPTLIPTTPRGNAFLEPGLRFSEDAVKAYREALAKVDEKVAADDDALEYGWTICLDLKQDKTDAQVAKNTAGRFEVDDTTVKAIVEATRTTLCSV